MAQLSFQFEHDFSREEQAVYALLRSGRANALSVDALSRETGLSGTRVRQVVRDLIMNHSILIASAVDEPPGFFIAQTRDEILMATKSLRHRGISILARAAKLQRAGLDIVYHLAKLEFSGEESRTE